MIRFSIIVPVYNVDKYLESCLKSILNQTYKDFEVIIVNDGSQDNSQDIIDAYAAKDKRIKAFIKDYSGVSDTRNYGINKATGDYLLFVDSDDTINCKLLDMLNAAIENNPDIIRFQVTKKEGNKEFKESTETFKNLSGEEAFAKLLKNSWFVSVWSAAYKKDFWDLNNFSFAKGKIHEDFGLIPYVYIKAGSVSSISYEGYNYFVRKNSIMTSNDIDKQKEKNDCCLYHYDHLLDLINKDKVVSKEGKKLYKSFIANSLITRVKSIDNKTLKSEYLKELNKRNIGGYLLDNTIPRKIKKIIFKLSPHLYIKLFVKE